MIINSAECCNDPRLLYSQYVWDLINFMVLATLKILGWRRNYINMYGFKKNVSDYLFKICMMTGLCQDDKNEIFIKGLLIVIIYGLG